MQWLADCDSSSLAITKTHGIQLAPAFKGEQSETSTRQPYPEPDAVLTQLHVARKLIGTSEVTDPPHTENEQTKLFLSAPLLELQRRSTLLVAESHFHRHICGIGCWLPYRHSGFFLKLPTGPKHCILWVPRPQRLHQFRSDFSKSR